ncbi:hypothetical protein [Arthrobacter sp. Soil761]|uniref:hypothetical protein n=1 Tax=Arthrobacter sp. Soil761 TaxID=1736400 RepID=UPI000A62DFB7|nr:hypothetical protein [Arthrobacter sp. Soil761]
MSQVDLERVRRPAGVALAAGAVWLAGISPVPGVYLEPDAARRLDMLRKGQRWWVAGQHVAAAGTAAMPAAFARLALALPPGRSRALAGTAAVALAAGAPLFVSELAMRASDLERFAARRFPAWPFHAYAWLHVLALGSLSGTLATLPHRKRRRQRWPSPVPGVEWYWRKQAIFRLSCSMSPSSLLPAACCAVNRTAVNPRLRRGSNYARTAKYLHPAKKPCLPKVGSRAF